MHEWNQVLDSLGKTGARMRVPEVSGKIYQDSCTQASPITPRGTKPEFSRNKFDRTSLFGRTESDSKELTG
jgi:hypothetical protein